MAVTMPALDPEIYVRQAVLRMHDVDGYSCAAELTIARITSHWSPGSVTWNGRPSSWVIKSGTSSGKDGSGGIVAPNCSYTGNAEVLDVTNLVRQWVGGAPVFGIRLGVGTNGSRNYHSVESSSTTMRPELHVQWGIRPAAPTELTITPGSPGETSTEEPTASVRLPAAPDGYRLRANFSVYNEEGSTIWTSSSASAAQGSVVSVPLPAGKLTNGSHYTVKAWAVDEYGTRSDSAASYPFKVDVYTAVVPAPGCVDPCIASSELPTYTFTVPAGGTHSQEMTMRELLWPDHVGTAWLRVTTPAVNVAGGIKLYPLEATIPALPTLPFATSAQTRTVMVPSSADTNAVTFTNTSTQAVTVTVTLLGAINGYTDAEKAFDAAIDDPELSAADAEAMASASMTAFDGYIDTSVHVPATPRLAPLEPRDTSTANSPVTSIAKRRSSNSASWEKRRLYSATSQCLSPF